MKLARICRVLQKPATVVLRAGLLLALTPFAVARCAHAPDAALASSSETSLTAQLPTFSTSVPALPKSAAVLEPTPEEAAPTSAAKATTELPAAPAPVATNPSAEFRASLAPAGEMEVAGDRPLYVIHAPRENRRIIVYLHGMCGDIYAVNSWREVAAEHGTLIALRGDTACGKGRYRWKDPASVLHERITRAIALVREARDGTLDADDLTLMGYSQGADRAERLATVYPEIYRRVILGGPPRQPKVANLQNAAAVAVLGGELEGYGHMLAGADALRAAGRPARFFLLPDAEHGQYGPSGRKVMHEVLHWILEPDATLAHGSAPPTDCEQPRHL